ncbi:YciI family protein [Actinomyces sp. B33]|uniref:YciI family protein n=1 Tax=Actinomyces sp. B33 TaxID=2942131 RepID=UPI0023403C0D|nr:YciI family protein [Actinomyces sp. B33]MDC4233271.1 YciI family protein [Actinomyces sp. B33]
MAYFALEYVYDTDQSELMDRLRPDHRAFLASCRDRGLVVASGPLVGAGRALIVVQADSVEDVFSVLDEDPFYTAGVILDRPIRQWDPVIRSF